VVWRDQIMHLAFVRRNEVHQGDHKGGFSGGMVAGCRPPEFAERPSNPKMPPRSHASVSSSFAPRLCS
jgi:hypothetical protein